MCGFVGVVNFVEGIKSVENLKLANDLMISRGPDNEGYFKNSFCQVGFRRLFKNVCQLAHCETIDLPQGVRTRKIEREKFWFNYDTESHKIEGKDFPPISVTREALKG